MTANFAINTYTLTYTAGANGTHHRDHPADGELRRRAARAVTAVPDTGYHFVNWSDASTANPRTDTNVTANVTRHGQLRECGSDNSGSGWPGGGT